MESSILDPLARLYLFRCAIARLACICICVTSGHSFLSFFYDTQCLFFLFGIFLLPVYTHG